MKNLLFVIVLFVGTLSFAQQYDSLFIRKIYDKALSENPAYENLRYLCKNIGQRISGSAAAQQAVEWSLRLMDSYGFDKAYLQPVMVPYWKRGTKEEGWYKTASGEIFKVNMLALGGSVGTNGTLEGDVVEFKTLESLKNASKAQVENKIVFVNEPMNAKNINTFESYDEGFAVRAFSALAAGKLGALAVVIRSVGLPIDDHPHTGAMYYNDSVKKIPAAALSTRDAENLSALLKKQKVKFIMRMDCQDMGMVPSFNVIAEIKGSVAPNKIITVGGHIDSWDTGEGAHDDGAGLMHSLEALSILKSLGYKPKHTLRVVFFMNEENGNNGGKSYAKLAKENNEEHIAAVESDAGGFVPRGFHCDGAVEKVNFLKSLAPIFKPYELHVFEKGYGGVDINPLKQQFESIALFGFIPDSQRYFDVHHSPNDVFENINKRELELGCAAMASLLYLIDLNF
ncbi:MAG: M20/M25/M40 family metallo-hydrolase [Crocinitomicaceae bacterium]|nr:M20/M25/M40 family metallo-hydrolase [Crocinitomicaceae bacterium]